MDNLKAIDKVDQLKAHNRRIRKRVYRRSKLDKFRGELITLRREGASATDLQRWLKQQRIRVTLTTVTRWLEKHVG